MSGRQTSGVQALERALRLLRDIAASAEQGRRLVDLQRSLKLTRPTAHRLLKTLAGYDLVFQDQVTRRYFMGREIAILALSAPKTLPDLRDLAHADMQALADDTGDTAFLMVRSGNDVVCIGRQLGPYPIKALTGEIGTRRPLGVGAAGIALLASLQDDEIEKILAANYDRLRHFPNATERLIRAAVRDARVKGYSYSDGHVIKAVRGVGVSVHDGRGRLVAALSIGAVRERITRDRIGSLVSALQRARRAIEQRLRQRRYRGVP